MRFKRIEFTNYRCFIEGEFVFDESPKKHINIILGNNGAGKTEALFAFWWVLYGFDFKTLKNKEATPYALNASLYKNIEADIISEAECKVTLELEHDGTTYVVERTAVFTKKKQLIDINEQQSVRKYKPNFELTLPETDQNKISKLLNRIVPKRILYGIVFDGERMKQLSSEDENSINAINGVISDITNIELLELCKLTYGQLQQTNSKLAKSLAKRRGKNSLSELINTIENNEKELIKQEQDLQEAKAKLDEYQRKADELSKRLRSIKETQELEQMRDGKREELRKEEEQRLTQLKSFPSSMKDGYYLCSKKLFDDVNSLLTKYDVPAGLTVPVVDNILERKTCICGNCWTKEMLAHIDKLKKTLPPDNINSTLGEMVRQKILQCGNIRSILIKESGNLAKTDKNISQIREDIASLSARISNSGSPDAKSIEKDNIEVQKNIGIYENKINELEDTIPELEKLLENERKERDNFQDHSGEIERINTKIALIDKCLKAIEQIKIMNQQTALKSINSILKEAYELLSDDADMGRRLYVIEHSEKHRMVSYLDKKLKQKLKSFKESGTYSKLVDAGLSEEQILEQAILKCELPNSTGQSKMNTLAFVKAILDYSNQKRPNDSIQITKQYPLLIDAPFGDIFDKNLEKSALALNDFTHQIILMIARDSYQSVEHFIKSGIKTVHILEKVKDEDRSIIKPCRLGAL